MHKKHLKKYSIAGLLLLPSVAIYSLFFIYPIIHSFFLSFTKWNGIPSTPKEWQGFQNYAVLLNNKMFWNALYNVFVFIGASLLILMPLALLLALFVNSKIRGSQIFKTSFFIPTVLPMTAIGLMWSFILYKSGGALNTMLDMVNLSNLTQDWLGDPKFAIYSVALVNTWVFAGYNMIIFLTGLTAIPEEIYEAAAVDGVTGVKQLFYITIPLMRETFKVFIVLAITGSLKVFDIIYVMTGGGPGTATDVPSTLLFKEAFRYNKFGYGSAIGIFILVTSLVSTVVLNKALNVQD